MRDFKFRAWIKPEYKWYPGVFGMREVYVINLHGYPIIGPDHIHVLANDNSDYIMVPKAMYELMQYTGLKDKNGKEIWEGDIVNGAVFGTTICYGTVDFWTGGFFIHPVVSSHADSIDLYNWIHSIEVIGNIYEHKHLLKNDQA